MCRMVLKSDHTREAYRLLMVAMDEGDGWLTLDYLIAHAGALVPHGMAHRRAVHFHGTERRVRPVSDEHLVAMGRRHYMRGALFEWQRMGGLLRRDVDGVTWLRLNVCPTCGQLERGVKGSMSSTKDILEYSKHREEVPLGPAHQDEGHHRATAG